jgi:hypothetical protein
MFARTTVLGRQHLLGRCSRRPGRRAVCRKHGRLTCDYRNCCFVVVGSVVEGMGVRE